MTESVPKVANRKVWEDVLSVMRIRTFQIIVLQVRLLRVFLSLGVQGSKPHSAERVLTNSQDQF